MFQLREEHHQAFQQATWDAFERRAIAHVRANFPDQASNRSDAQLQARIRSEYRRAQQYGFQSERQIMCFIDTGFLIGLDFDSRQETSWTQTILRYPDFSTDQRAEVLLAGAQKAVEEEDGVDKDA